jgi:hypothetical protein
MSDRIPVTTIASAPNAFDRGVQHVGPVMAKIEAH